VTRIANQGSASGQSAMSQVHTKSTADHRAALGGDKRLDAISLHGVDTIKSAFEAVHRGDDRWALLGYVSGKKDVLEFVSSGQDLESLGAAILPDDIVYAMVSCTAKETTTTTQKFLLCTMVGDSCGALKKARSAAHRTDLAVFAQGFMPFHSHFPVTSPDDLSEKEFLFKLRS
jgi:Cofilin/tropomyosin-type actin-binding protein